MKKEKIIARIGLWGFGVYLLKSHISKKEQLKETGSDKEIANQDKMIKIWSKNIEKIKREINKIQIKG